MDYESGGRHHRCRRRYSINFATQRRDSAGSAAGAGYEGLTRKYSVEGSTDLSNPAAWQALPGYTDIVGDEQTVSVPLPLASPNMFYRLNVRVE